MGQRAIPSWISRHSYHSAGKPSRTKNLIIEMKDGDVMEVAISDIGGLRNPAVRKR
jgi:hypothetical protein